MVTLPKLRQWLEQRQIDSPYSALRRALQCRELQHMDARATPTAYPLAFTDHFR
jgi:hypothetical protein